MPTRELEEKRRSFEEIALPLLLVVHRTARRLTRDTERAGDLTQETYLRAYRTFDNFRPGTNCKAWLLTILYSIFVNQYRKERREPPSIAIQDLEERFHELASSSDNPVRWSDREVVAALERLPEESRSVVLLVDVEELTYEEAAAALGCPIGTVRSRLSRARKALFVSLQEYARRAGYIGATEE
ncbi:MAG TPA: sigma-70 family RNA polymerase sigma factor [Thermoanaerobaculia bacterium]